MVMNVKTKKIKELSISEISLGTVQLGLPYGLKENAITPTSLEVQNVLSYAYEQGINSFDTAAAYGNSEEKIGQWINGRQLCITTKIHDLDISSESALISSMREAVLQSMKKLQLSSIPILMIHHFDEYFENKKIFDKAFSVMKDEGHILYSGVSAYSTDNYFDIAESGLDSVQIPINILDLDQVNTGGLKRIAESGMIVFGRSIYLQGLLLRSPEKLKSGMFYVEDTLKKYIQLCDKFNLSQRELAMFFVLSLHDVTSLVIGCRDVMQVKGNIETYMKYKKLSDEQMGEIIEMFSGTEKKIVIPMMWPK